MKFCFSSLVPDIHRTVCVDARFPAALHLSHWPGNATPQELKGDTSTEIVFRLLHHPEKAEYLNVIEFVSNNHFDADGLTAVFSLLFPDNALRHETMLKHIALTGDFQEYCSDDAFKAAAVIENLEKAHLSPDRYPESVELLYHKSFSILSSLLDDIEPFRPEWKDEFSKFLLCENMFTAKQAIFSNYQDCNLSVIETPLPLHPVSVIKWAEHDIILLCQKDPASGYFYKLFPKQATWFDTLRGYPPEIRKDFATFAKELNQINTDVHGSWTVSAEKPASAYDYNMAFRDGGFNEIPSKLPIFEMEELTLNFLSNV